MPSRYPVEVALIEELHWTMQDIHNAPADLVDELWTRIMARRKAEHEKHKMDKAIAKSRSKASKAKKR